MSSKYSIFRQRFGMFQGCEEETAQLVQGAGGEPFVVLGEPASRIGLLALDLDALARGFGDPPEGEHSRESAHQRQGERRNERRDHRPAKAPAPGLLDRRDGSSRDRPAVEEAAEVLGQCLGARVTPTGSLLETLQTDGLEVARDLGTEPARGDRFPSLDLLHRLDVGIRQERRSAGDQLVQDDAHRVDVGGRSRCRPPARDLLGSHVE